MTPKKMCTIIFGALAAAGAGVLGAQQLFGATASTLGTVFLRKADAETTYVKKETYIIEKATVADKLTELNKKQEKTNDLLLELVKQGRDK